MWYVTCELLMAFVKLISPLYLRFLEQATFGLAPNG